jgi:hypothetical protein
MLEYNCYFGLLRGLLRIVFTAFIACSAETCSSKQVGVSVPSRTRHVSVGGCVCADVSLTQCRTISCAAYIPHALHYRRWQRVRVQM